MWLQRSSERKHLPKFCQVQNLCLDNLPCKGENAGWLICRPWCRTFSWTPLWSVLLLFWRDFQPLIEGRARTRELSVEKYYCTSVPGGGYDCGAGGMGSMYRSSFSSFERGLRRLWLRSRSSRWCLGRLLQQGFGTEKNFDLSTHFPRVFPLESESSSCCRWVCVPISRRISRPGTVPFAEPLFAGRSGLED